MNIRKELKDHILIRRKGQKGSLKIYNGKRLNIVDPKKKVKKSNERFNNIIF